MFYPMYFSGYYAIGYVLVAIGSILMIYAQTKVKGSYRKYSQIPSSCHLTGCEVARQILDSQGLNDVTIEQVNGQLSDHYNPSKRSVSLSQGIYQGTSIASLAVAAHECGHAIQHANQYRPLIIRDFLVPICNIGQTLGWIALFAGLILGMLNLAWVGVILMSLMLVFQIVTLPVEFDASKRALVILGNQYLSAQEFQGAKNMLSAAAFTYVASALATLLSILRLVLIVVGNNRD